MWYNEFGSVFFITITAALVGLVGLVVKSCYKSKCSDFICCFGLLKIKRDTDIEEQIDLRITDTIPNEI